MRNKEKRKKCRKERRGDEEKKQINSGKVREKKRE